MSHRDSGRPLAFVTLALSLASAPACTGGRILPSALPEEAPPRRAAESFIHCVEAGTSNCVAAGEEHRGWDSLHMLLWLASGSPLGVLEALPRQLAAHVDPLRTQGAFVGEVERYAAVLRGAECESTSSQDAKSLIDNVAKVAHERLERLGMSRTGLGEVIDRLADEAHADLDGGHLVRLDCAHEPFRVYVATRQGHGRLTVVGMTTVLAPQFVGDVPSRQDVEVRLRSDALGLEDAAVPVLEGTIDPWLPFQLEEL